MGAIQLFAKPQVHRARKRRVKLFVSFSLTTVTFTVTYHPNLAQYSIGRGPGGIPGSRGRVRIPRAGLQPALGRLWASTLRLYDRSARCALDLGTGSGG